MSASELEDIIRHYDRSEGFNAQRLHRFYDDNSFDALAAFGSRALHLVQQPGGEVLDAGRAHPIRDTAWAANAGAVWTLGKSLVFELVIHMRGGHPSLRESPGFQSKAGGWDAEAWYAIDQILADYMRVAKAYSDQHREWTNAQFVARNVNAQSRSISERESRQEQANIAGRWLASSFENKIHVITGKTPREFFDKQIFTRTYFIAFFERYCEQAEIAGQPSPTLADAEVSYLIGAAKYFTQNPPDPYWRKHPGTVPHPQPLGSSLLLFACWRGCLDADDISPEGREAWFGMRNTLWRSVKPTSILPRRPDLEGAVRDEQGLLYVPFPRPPVIDRPVVRVGDVITCPKCRARYQIQTEEFEEFVCDGTYQPPARKGLYHFTFPPVEKCNYRFRGYSEKYVQRMKDAYHPHYHVFDAKGDWLRDESAPSLPFQPLMPSPSPWYTPPFWVEHAPIEAPVPEEQPVSDPYDQPGFNPYEQPVDNPYDQPGFNPYEQPVGNP
jgi:hypothetical protein